MKVIGMGVDLVEVSRFERTLRRLGNPLLTKLFTRRELRYALERKTAVQHLAARFAAKEAVVKALGAPKGLGLKWKDLEITHAKNGQPQAVFHGTMSRWKNLKVLISLTHTSSVAVATAFIFSP